MPSGVQIAVSYFSPVLPSLRLVLAQGASWARQGLSFLLVVNWRNGDSERLGDRAEMLVSPCPVLTSGHIHNWLKPVMFLSELQTALFGGYSKWTPLNLARTLHAVTMPWSQLACTPVDPSVRSYFICNVKSLLSKQKAHKEYIDTNFCLCSWHPLKWCLSALCRSHLQQTW